MTIKTDLVDGYVMFPLPVPTYLKEKWNNEAKRDSLSKEYDMFIWWKKQIKQMAKKLRLKYINSLQMY